MCRALITCLLIIAARVAVRADEADLTVLKALDGQVPPGQQLEVWLKNGFYQMVEQRAAAFEKAIKSTASCEVWQQQRRTFFLNQIGGLPERTPLNPQVVGTLQGDGYRVERILLESRPGFHVAGNLYLPESPPPWPAVLVPCGHSHDGKAAGQYQRACVLLARNGMAAMCYDPLGQGERYQILDLTQERGVFEDASHVATPHPNVRLMCTTEHTMIGIGSTLLGANVAQFRIWDGMRVIDYLQSRSDIMADKIGCTGNSGGGTETAYLMALDDRIVAAAPGCYLTTFRRLIDTKGPQDGEQNIFGQIAFGMDEADYCIMRAPKPTLICAGTRDATFDFQGTWELFRDAKRFYSRIRHPESMDLVAADAPHGFTLPLREAVARFMSRWLLGQDKVIREVRSLPDTLTDEQLRNYSQGDWTAEQLRCTPEGQVLLMPGERSAFRINAETAETLKKMRSAKWAGLSPDERRKLVRDTLGLSAEEIPHSDKPEVRIDATLARGDCTIQKIVLTIEPGLDLPALAFVPKQPSGGATLYLSGQSMKQDATPGGAIDALLKKGQIVLAAELRGIGETETGHGKNEFGRGRFGPDNLEIFTAYLMGKSFVAMRVQDAQGWMRVLQRSDWNGVRLSRLNLVATGEAAIPALHAAALDPKVFASVSLRGMIRSWEEVVAATETINQSVNMIHGVLRQYDLPDLIDLIGQERVSITEPVNVMGKPLQ